MDKRQIIEVALATYITERDFIMKEYSDPSTSTLAELKEYLAERNLLFGICFFIEKGIEYSAGTEEWIMKYVKTNSRGSTDTLFVKYWTGAPQFLSTRGEIFESMEERIRILKEELALT